MDTEGSSTAQRAAGEGGVGAHFVHGMTGFVQGAEQGGSQIVGEDARGDAHIPQAEVGGEWMEGLILPAAVPIKAHFGDDLHAEVPLLLLVIGQVHEGVVHLRAGGNLPDQLHLLWAQGVEDSLDIGGLETRLESYPPWGHKCGRRVQIIRHNGDAKSRTFSRWGWKWAKLFSARAFRPGFMSCGGDHGDFHHQFNGNLDLFVIVAAGDLDEAGFERVGVELGDVRLQVIEQPTDLIGDELGVGDLPEGGELITPVLRTAGWHIGLLVPAQQGGGMIQV